MTSVLSHIITQSELSTDLSPDQINRAVNISEECFSLVSRSESGQQMWLSLIDLLLNESRSVLEESQQLYMTSERFESLEIYSEILRNLVIQDILSVPM